MWIQDRDGKLIPDLSKLVSPVGLLAWVETSDVFKENLLHVDTRHFIPPKK